MWGHISPGTPLNPSDCPPDMTSGCVYSDLYAYQWAKTSKLTGSYGLTLADFNDSEPANPSTYQNFNPSLVALFAKQYGYSNPQPSWIIQTAYSNWNDFISNTYAHFFNQLVSRINQATGYQALIIGAGDTSPGWRRCVGTDNRIIAKGMNPKNYLTHFDSQSIQVGRQGPVQAPPNQELSPIVLSAAREPLIRNGIILEADDAAYWSAISTFYPSLNANDQKEVGYKLLKRIWIWIENAHILDRSGNVRRAIAYASRDYWDTGTIDTIPNLTKVLKDIIPARPFGPALYYSTSVERAVESQTNQTGQLPTTYMLPNVLQQFLDQGAPIGFYVSDASLAKLKKQDAPSAWVVLNAGSMLPSPELAELSKTAPVVTNISDLNSLPNQPLTLPPWISGFAFYKDNGHLVLILTNTSTLPDSTSNSGQITLNLLDFPDGSYSLKELFSNSKAAINVSKGHAQFQVNISRWDTQVFVLSP